MPISVKFKAIDGIAFYPSDLSWSEAQSIGVDLDNNGSVLQASFSRPALQGDAKGLSVDVIRNYFEQSKQNRVSLVLGSSPSSTLIDVSGRSINGYLSKVEPGGSITVNRIEIVESCRLTWEAIEFE